MQGCKVSIVGSLMSADPVTQPAMATVLIQPSPGHAIITPLASAMSMIIRFTSQAIGRKIPWQTLPALGQIMGQAGQSQEHTESIVSKLLFGSPQNKSLRPFYPS